MLNDEVYSYGFTINRNQSRSLPGRKISVLLQSYNAPEMSFQTKKNLLYGITKLALKMVVFSSQMTYCAHEFYGTGDYAIQVRRD